VWGGKGTNEVETKCIGVVETDKMIELEGKAAAGWRGASKLRAKVARWGVKTRLGGKEVDVAVNWATFVKAVERKTDRRKKSGTQEGKREARGRKGMKTKSSSDRGPGRQTDMVCTCMPGPKWGGRGREKKRKMMSPTERGDTQVKGLKGKRLKLKRLRKKKGGSTKKWRSMMRGTIISRIGKP